MKVYIGFSKPTPGGFPILAWIIQAIDKRPYDHCYIRFSDPTTGSPLIFQASQTIVNLYGPRIFTSINIPVKEYEIDVTPEQHLALWNFVKDNLGIPYSLLEDFGILLMKVFRLKANPYNNHLSAVFCSELVCLVAPILGLVIPGNPDSIDPSALDTILSQKGVKCNENVTF